MITLRIFLYIFLSILAQAPLRVWAQDSVSVSLVNAPSDSKVNASDALRAKEKVLWLARIRQEEYDRKDKINKEAENLYAVAIALYRDGKFEDAQRKFQEVDWVMPHYKSTLKYLARVQRNIQKEKRRLYQQQQQVLEEQRRQKEFNQKKSEQQQIEELQAKERQRKRDMKDQAQTLYTAAVALFDQHDMDLALLKFKSVEALYPDFKLTRIYRARIDQWKLDQEQLRVQSAQELRAEKLRQEALNAEHQRIRALQDKKDAIEACYDKALGYYRARRLQEAKGAFESVIHMDSDFKHARRYLDKIQTILARSRLEPSHKTVVRNFVKRSAPLRSELKLVKVLPIVKPVESRRPVASLAVAKSFSLEYQQEQALEIARLAERSARLYRQIADVADEPFTLATKRKMAQVDAILNDLKERKNRWVRRTRQEQLENQQAQIEKKYQEALVNLRDNNYAQAKIEFLQVQSWAPDYKSTHRYLVRIENYQHSANVQAVTAHEQKEAVHLKQLENTENIAESKRRQAEQERQQIERQRQSSALKALAQKASAINEAIIQLSRVGDYEGMKVKFVQLESTIADLTVLKSAMDSAQENQERVAHLAASYAGIARDRQAEYRRIHAHSSDQTPKRLMLSSQPVDLPYFKSREIMREQNALFRDGVNCYARKQYTQAKLLFGELSLKRDRRAEVWLKKVDRAITRELLKSQEAEERERGAFILNQINAQRQLIAIQEREHQRQKELSQELERQKRLYEDNRLSGLRKEEILKFQERERKLQEEKRRQLEKDNERQEESLRFHKIRIVNKPFLPLVIPSKPVYVKPVVPALVKPLATPRFVIKATPVVDKQKQSLEQKKLLEQKQLLEQKRKQELMAREQKEKDRQLKIKEKEQAREKFREERKKEKEHQRALKLKAKEKRQAQIKAQQEARLKLKAQDQELKDNQQRERQTRMRLEREERERQAELETRRQAVHKELEDGVEAMYQEAVNLYKQGEYKIAVDKFKDVEDILPGYKQVEQYMNDARQKSISVSSMGPA